MKAGVITAAAMALLLAGCVEREMTITSEPPGAIVYVSSVEVGRTPVTIPFTWYGDYDIVLRQGGYETVTTHAVINMPPYEIPPVDLLSAMAPWVYHDQRYLFYKMTRQKQLTDQELIRRADALQKENLRQPAK